MQEFWMAPFIKSSNISPTFLLSTQMFLPLYRSFMDQDAPAPWRVSLYSEVQHPKSESSNSASYFGFSANS